MAHSLAIIVLVNMGLVHVLADTRSSVSGCTGGLCDIGIRATLTRSRWAVDLELTLFRQTAVSEVKNELKLD